MLEKSLLAFEEELAALSQKAAVPDWSTTEASLGRSLQRLHQTDIEMLKHSIDEIKTTLEGLNQEENAQNYAIAQDKLAAALHAQGQHQADTPDLLDDAMEAYKKVLMIWKRQEVPLDWARTFNNLSMVFQTMGEQQKEVRFLENSVAAFNNTFAIRKRKDTPEDWALSRNNAGVSLQLIGELLDDPERLQESIQSYQDALEAMSQETNPMGWVITKANLGATKKILAEKTESMLFARQAVADFEQIVRFLQTSNYTAYLNLAIEHRAKARDVLAVFC